MFFVSVDSKKLSFYISLFFSTLTSKSTSVDYKGLALHQNSAEMGCFWFVFKRIKTVTLTWRDLILRLTGRERRPPRRFTYTLLYLPVSESQQEKGVGQAVVRQRVAADCVVGVKIATH